MSPGSRKQSVPTWLRDYADPREELEKVVYEWVCGVYRTAGVIVIRHSQPFRAAQTRGLWDCECWFRRPISDTTHRTSYSYLDREGNGWDVFHWGHEVKRYRKTAGPIQVNFHRQMALYNIPTVVGGLNTAIRQLAELGIAQFEERPQHW